MKNKDFDAGKLLQIALGASCMLALAYLLIYAQGTDGFPEEATRLGQLGDFFGGILNPTVSVLTLFVAIGVWRLQKNELELTRNELKETKEAMKSQDETAKQQRQEQRFFDLLNVYQRTVDSITHSRYRNSVQGEILDSMGKQAISSWLSMSGRINRMAAQSGKTEEPAALKQDWQNLDAAGNFNHYFRVVFRILSEAEALLGDQHFRYIKLFRAQLSRSELIILAYNLWLDDEGKKMIPPAEKYGLLKHLPKGHLRTTLEQELPPQVFGRTRSTELAATSPAPSIEETT